MDWDSTGSAHLDPCHKGLPLPLWRRIIRLAQQDPGDVLAPVAVACTLELRALRLVSKSGQNLVDLLLDYVKAREGRARRLGVSVWGFLRHLPHLTSFEYIGCPRDISLEPKPFCQSSMLRHLRVHTVPPGASGTLVSWLRDCPHLRQLCMPLQAPTSEVTLLLRELPPHLTDLALRGCQSVAPSAWQHLASLTHLSRLSLQGLSMPPSMIALQCWATGLVGLRELELVAAPQAAYHTAGLASLHHNKLAGPVSWEDILPQLAPCMPGLSRLAFYPHWLPDQGHTLALGLPACTSLRTLELGGSGGPPLELHTGVWQALAALPALERICITHAIVATPDAQMQIGEACSVADYSLGGTRRWERAAGSAAAGGGGGVPAPGDSLGHRQGWDALSALSCASNGGQSGNVGAVAVQAQAEQQRIGIACLLAAAQKQAQGHAGSPIAQPVRRSAAAYGQRAAAQVSMPLRATTGGMAGTGSGLGAGLPRRGVKEASHVPHVVQPVAAVSAGPVNQQSAHQLGSCAEDDELMNMPVMMSDPDEPLDEMLVSSRGHAKQGNGGNEGDDNRYVPALWVASHGKLPEDTLIAAADRMQQTQQHAPGGMCKQIASDVRVEGGHGHGHRGSSHALADICAGSAQGYEGYEDQHPAQSYTAANEQTASEAKSLSPNIQPPALRQQEEQMCCNEVLPRPESPFAFGLSSGSGLIGPAEASTHDFGAFRTCSVDDAFDAELQRAIELSKMDACQTGQLTSTCQASPLTFTCQTGPLASTCQAGQITSTCQANQPQQNPAEPNERHPSDQEGVMQGGAVAGRAAETSLSSRPDSPSKRDCWGWDDAGGGGESSIGRWDGLFDLNFEDQYPIAHTQPWDDLHAPWCAAAEPEFLPPPAPSPNHSLQLTPHTELHGGFGSCAMGTSMVVPSTPTGSPRVSRASLAFDSMFASPIASGHQHTTDHWAGDAEALPLDTSQPWKTKEQEDEEARVVAEVREAARQAGLLDWAEGADNHISLLTSHAKDKSCLFGTANEVHAEVTLHGGKGVGFGAQRWCKPPVGKAGKRFYGSTWRKSAAGSGRRGTSALPDPGGQEWIQSLTQSDNEDGVELHINLTAQQGIRRHGSSSSRSTGGIADPSAGISPKWGRAVGEDGVHVCTGQGRSQLKRMTKQHAKLPSQQMAEANDQDQEHTGRSSPLPHSQQVHVTHGRNSSSSSSGTGAILPVQAASGGLEEKVASDTHRDGASAVLGGGSQAGAVKHRSHNGDSEDDAHVTDDRGSAVFKESLATDNSSGSASDAEEDDEGGSVLQTSADVVSGTAKWRTRGTDSTRLHSAHSVHGASSPGKARGLGALQQKVKVHTPRSNIHISPNTHRTAQHTLAQRGHAQPLSLWDDDQQQRHPSESLEPVFGTRTKLRGTSSMQQSGLHGIAPYESIALWAKPVHSIQANMHAGQLQTSPGQKHPWPYVHGPGVLHAQALPGPAVRSMVGSGQLLLLRQLSICDCGAIDAPALRALGGLPLLHALSLCGLSRPYDDVMLEWSRVMSPSLQALELAMDPPALALHREACSTHTCKQAWLHEHMPQRGAWTSTGHEQGVGWEQQPRAKWLGSCPAPAAAAAWRYEPGSNAEAAWWQGSGQKMMQVKSWDNAQTGTAHVPTPWAAELQGAKQNANAITAEAVADWQHSPTVMEYRCQEATLGAVPSPTATPVPGAIVAGGMVPAPVFPPRVCTPPFSPLHKVCLNPASAHARTGKDAGPVPAAAAAYHSLEQAAGLQALAPVPPAMPMQHVTYPCPDMDSMACAAAADGTLADTATRVHPTTASGLTQEASRSLPASPLPSAPLDLTGAPAAEQSGECTAAGTPSTRTLEHSLDGSSVACHTHPHSSRAPTRSGSFSQGACASTVAALLAGRGDQTGACTAPEARAGYAGSASSTRDCSGSSAACIPSCPAEAGTQHVSSKAPLQAAFLEKCEENAQAVVARCMADMSQADVDEHGVKVARSALADHDGSQPQDMTCSLDAAVLNTGEEQGPLERGPDGCDQCDQASCYQPVQDAMPSPPLSVGQRADAALRLVAAWAGQHADNSSLSPSSNASTCTIMPGLEGYSNSGFNGGQCYAAAAMRGIDTQPVTPSSSTWCSSSVSPSTGASSSAVQTPVRVRNAFFGPGRDMDASPSSHDTSAWSPTGGLLHSTYASASTPWYPKGTQSAQHQARLPPWKQPVSGGAPAADSGSADWLSWLKDVSPAWPHSPAVGALGQRDRGQGTMQSVLEPDAGLRALLMDRLSGLHELRLAHLPHVGCGLIEALVGRAACRAAQQQQEGGLHALQVVACERVGADACEALAASAVADDLPLHLLLIPPPA